MTPTEQDKMSDIDKLEKRLSEWANRVSIGDLMPDTLVRGAVELITAETKRVALEAKPEKRTPDYYSDSIDLYSRQCAANSWNKAIDQFEQNLLKALEEV